MKVRMNIKALWPYLPYHNSDAGVEVKYHRTPKGAVVDEVETVVANMSSFISGPYGLEPGTVLMTAPRWYGDFPSTRQAMADWREEIASAVIGAIES